MILSFLRRPSTATISLTAFLLLTSAPAMAFLDIQLIGGARSAQWEYEKDDGKHEKPVTSTEVGLSIHASPFKNAPVSFGLAVQQNDFDLSKAVTDEYEGITIDSDDGTSYALEDITANLQGLTYGPEVMAWIPMAKGAFRPFLRVGYTMGSYDMIGTFEAGAASAKTEDNYKVSGAHYGLGFVYSPARHFGFLLEYTMSQQTMDIQKGKLTFTTPAGSETIEMTRDDFDAEDKSVKFNSGAARLGLNFSF